MVKLNQATPAADLLPLQIGSVSLTEIELPEGKTWSVSPLSGKASSSLPAPGKSKLTKTSETVWVGQNQYLQIGGRRPATGAVTDQSSAWVRVRIEGADTFNVLARLSPVPLSQAKPGDVMRSLVNHMTAILIRTETGVDVMVFRAFAKTLVNELEEAANRVQARSQLGL